MPYRSCRKKAVYVARKIEVVDYNPQWAKDFKAESKKIKEILGKNCIGIHHIGSTAVKGMKAKPTIDMMAIVKDLSAVNELLSKFDALGYEYKGEYGIRGRRFFTKGGTNHTHHLHIYEEKNKKDTSRHLAVREYLNNHPETAKEYGELKAKLAEEFTYDPDGYCNGKDAYVKELEQKAIKWTEKQMLLSNYVSMGMSLGMCIGMAIGMAGGNMVLGMSMGMCIGVAVGSVIGTLKNKKES